MNEQAVQMLRNARAHVADLQNVEADSVEWDALEEAFAPLDTLADYPPECDCGAPAECFSARCGTKWTQPCRDTSKMFERSIFAIKSCILLYHTTAVIFIQIKDMIAECVGRGRCPLVKPVSARHSNCPLIPRSERGPHRSRQPTRSLPHRRRCFS